MGNGLRKGADAASMRLAGDLSVGGEAHWVRMLERQEANAIWMSSRRRQSAKTL